MSDISEKSFTFKNFLENIPVFSHNQWELTIKKINVNVLEMEDVLFHHDSAVMMPRSPEDKSGKKKGSKKQETVTGIRALALIFRQFEFDPDKRIIVTGHTDTSGSAKYNFELSKLRAQNVMYLLTNKKKEWAAVCYEKQKIEDYQQIMKHFARELKWSCNPGSIDNKFGRRTKSAIKNFVKNYFT